MHCFQLSAHPLDWKSAMGLPFVVDVAILLCLTLGCASRINLTALIRLGLVKF